MIGDGEEEEEPEVCTWCAGSDSKGQRKDGVVFLRGLWCSPPQTSARGRAHGQTAVREREKPEGLLCASDCTTISLGCLSPHSFTRTNEELVAFLSKNRDKNFLKSHGRDNSR